VSIPEEVLVRKTSEKGHSFFLKKKMEAKGKGEGVKACLREVKKTK